MRSFKDEEKDAGETECGCCTELADVRLAEELQQGAAGGVPLREDRANMEKIQADQFEEIGERLTLSEEKGFQKG